MPADVVPGADAVAASEPNPETEAEAEAETEAEAEAAVADEEPRPVADGPVFEVSDRRSSITVDSSGVTFRLDDETAEFDWSEIGAVETDTPRFDRRLTVRVYTTNRRSYHVHVEAPKRNLRRQWATELDTVLDSYFEDTDTAH
ncbi:hypothetical protein [Streptomyces sp. URMC 124]|uniref:hypothetical protein n=1 Tax=Streptomyces sp. URMC 124 TaxID=3423405 RepID=UPI003F1D6603